MRHEFNDKMVRPKEDKRLTCACCNQPFARLQNGAIVITSRHHGDRHTNCISLTDVLELLQEDHGSTKDRRSEGGG